MVVLSSILIYESDDPGSRFSPLISTVNQWFKQGPTYTRSLHVLDLVSNWVDFFFSTQTPRSIEEEPDSGFSEHLRKVNIRFPKFLTSLLEKIEPLVWQQRNSKSFRYNQNQGPFSKKIPLPERKNSGWWRGVVGCGSQKRDPSIPQKSYQGDVKGANILVDLNFNVRWPQWDFWQLFKWWRLAGSIMLWWKVYFDFVRTGTPYIFYY